MRSIIVGVIGIAALIFNPLFACEQLRPFQFGETEMRAAIEGTGSST